MSVIALDVFKPFNPIIDVAGLGSDIPVYVPLVIRNNEPVTLWLEIDVVKDRPEILQTYKSVIKADPEDLLKSCVGFLRSAPTMSGVKYSEIINVVIRGYTDANLTKFYGSTSFQVPVTYIDTSSPNWAKKVVVDPNNLYSHLEIVDMPCPQYDEYGCGGDAWTDTCMYLPYNNCIEVGAGGINRWAHIYGDLSGCSECYACLDAYAKGGIVIAFQNNNELYTKNLNDVVEHHIKLCIPIDCGSKAGPYITMFDYDVISCRLELGSVILVGI